MDNFLDSIHSIQELGLHGLTIYTRRTNLQYARLYPILNLYRS